MILRKHIVKIIKRNHGAEFEYNNVALLNNENFLKKIEVAAEQLRKVIFHDLLISHLLIITLIVYKLVGFFEISYETFLKSPFFHEKNNLLKSLKLIITSKYCFNQIIDRFKRY